MMNITFEFIISGIIAISITALFIAILTDFIFYEKREEVKREKKSIVATGTMVMYYFVYLIIIKLKLGHISIADRPAYIFVNVVGALLVLTGSIMNISGRIKLQGNWANHIKIYGDHSLVTTGIYSLVRHPLYASLMIMLFGGSIAYANFLSAVLTIVIFIPFMYYRAKQEEVLLEKEFKNYAEYKKRTGMFFPKLWRR
ncbi:MAG: isoprenylcysteine carboxylmethyltransferase family protein [Clostridiaceae bacterium]